MVYKPSQEVNYRRKICVNFNNFEYYHDSITSIHLLELANKIIKHASQIGDKHIWNYMILIRLDDQIGVKIIFKNCLNDPRHIATEILNKISNIRIFCYQYTNNRSSPIKTTPIFYLLGYRFNPTVTMNWFRCLDSFIQIHPEVETHVHSIVERLLRICNPSYNKNYLGIGGESAYYALKSSWNQIINMTNSPTIHDDNIYNYKQNIYNYKQNEINNEINNNMDNKKNKIDNRLVDYNQLKLTGYDESWILLVNIGRKGLGSKLTYNILENAFSDIIYIGCSENWIEKDLRLLNLKYNLIEKNQIEMFPGTKNLGGVYYLNKNKMT